ncbi:ComEC/Rec2 family competence protein [Chryseobacterium sp. RLHN22]|uniref:ComEC/Rec2 family competence protein n=1 Tax=Chryseobacterium sp. RLHN22 TaxID=3437885 RepID=UPI003D9B5CF6
MEFEINMINVENGDAILLMLKDGERKSLIVIDGGYKKYYPKVKKRIEELLPLFDDKIDLLICTHYDNDHIGGIEKILDEYHDKIQEIWIHTIEETVEQEVIFLNEQINSLQKNFIFVDYPSKISANFVIEAYQDLLRVVKKIREYNLEEKMSQPFKGKIFQKFSEFKVAGPTYTFYERNLPALRKEAIKEDLKANYENNKIDGIRKFSEFIADRKKIPDNQINDGSILEKSSLQNGVTATNMVSIITLLQVGTKKILFTGDAGIESFENEIPLWDTDLKDLFFLSLPHHGSKNNTSKKMIDIFNPQYVFVSAKGNKNYPSEHITNYMKSQRNLLKFEVSNSDSKTWYLKIDHNGNFTRIFEKPFFT